MHALRGALWSRSCATRARWRDSRSTLARLGLNAAVDGRLRGRCRPRRRRNELPRRRPASPISPVTQWMRASGLYRARKRGLGADRDRDRRRRRSQGQGFAAAWARLGRPRSSQSGTLGRYEEAGSGRPPIVAKDRSPRGWRREALPELIEGASRAGNAGRHASEALAAVLTDDRREPVARDVGARRPRAQPGVVERGLTPRRALCTARRIERLSRTLLRPDLARAQLVYGEWLRGEAGTPSPRQLNAAHAPLHVDRHGGVRRARAKGACGDRRGVRRAASRYGTSYTEQRRQIAQLASMAGRIPEIGARLFLSPRPSSGTCARCSLKLGVLRPRGGARERAVRGT
jgi:hypothetical protein